MKVIKKFYGIQERRLYDVGEIYDGIRAEELKRKGFLEDAAPNYQAMTKAELGQMLTERGIDFDPKQTKAELISLLE